jgi:O-antigen/teichoic acid export membrane protein
MKSLGTSKYRKIFTDSIISIVALVIMNLALQFVVYPFWKKTYGTDVYGEIVYVMSFVNIFGVAVGSAVNYARMVESGKRDTKGSDYLTVVVTLGILGTLVTSCAAYFGKAEMSACDSILAGILCFLTVLRFYGDVEYRLCINYKGYFIYYLQISIGYGLGLLFMLGTGIWPLALIPGEVMGLLYVKRRGNVLSDKLFDTGNFFRENLHTMELLIATNLISNLIFNGDRLLLMNLVGAGAVTTYYIASLVGKTMTLITTPLNSVIIGYLARFKGEFNRKLVGMLFTMTLGAIVIFSFLSVPGSYIIVYFLYREDLDMVKKYFLIAGAAQVIYFVSNVVTTVLLKLAKADYQLKINVAYGILFLALCIPAAYFYKVTGFCIAILIVNISRYLISIFLCYKSAERE